MLYKDLVGYYGRLSGTTLKSKKTAIVAELLEMQTEDEIEMIVLLLQGRVFPGWSTMELGVASNLLIKALSKVYGTPEPKIQDEWRKLGDLGDVAHAIASKKKQNTLFSQPLTAKTVFENLKKVATLTGAKSQEAKLGLIGELFSKASADEARYIARTVLMDLRVGVAEGIVRDAIAKAYFADVYWSELLFAKQKNTFFHDALFERIKDKTVVLDETMGQELALLPVYAALKERNTVHIMPEERIKGMASFWKKKARVDYIFLSSAEVGTELRANIVRTVEQAYEVVNDYAEVAKLALAEGEKGLGNVQLSLFRPLKVMLAQKVDTIEEGFKTVGKPMALEYKYDGFRLQIHKEGEKVLLFTRRLEDVTKQFPDVVQGVLKAIECESCIIEGEAVGRDAKSGKYLAFQKVSQRIKRKYGIEEMAKEIPVELNLFDIVSLNGKALLSAPYQERRRKLESIVKWGKSPVVKLAEQLITESDEEAKTFYEKALSLGNEGCMLKSLTAPYKPGSRVGHMLKLKPVMDTLDLVIIGADYGTGKRAGWLSSFVLACQTPLGFQAVGMMSTGVKEKSSEGTSYDEMTKLLKDHITREEGRSVEVEPSLIIEVAYEEIQKSPTYESGFALRFPRLVRIRTDKGLHEVDTIDKIEGLYQAQRSRNI